MDQTEPPAFTQLKEHLREMFQLDRGDLDFGIYRIMNMRRQQVEDFLDNRLLPQVREILESYRPGGLERQRQDMADAEENPGKYNPEYIENLEKILSYDIDVDKMEVEIYSDLYNFFSRYYSEGDFLSLRRYKEGVYALPYEGEEVKLHWANHDQYYIKTSENLKHYAFRVLDGRRVRFAIKNGCTEKNNNKAANGKERRFILAEDGPVVIEEDEASIYFDYRPDKAKRSQDKINLDTLKTLLAYQELAEFGISTPAPSDSNSERTLLEKHLATYTAKFTFDYFIHKDLEGFLRRELDFYIKNEIMHLDDVENEVAPHVEKYLAKIRALRQVAGKIIQFLAQIEEFQKKLWLKKKFVLETYYCITLDHIIGKEAESDLLTQIAANDEQREEWVQLFAIDELDGYTNPLTEAFLKANDKLQVDTRFFNAEFKYTLLASIDNLDDATDGLLINSENFQALHVLHEKYRSKIKCIYIDPPYNAISSEIPYKNSYRNSSWLCLMDNRIKSSMPLLDDKFVFVSAIDEVEQELLGQIINLNFSGCDKTCITIVHNATGQQGTNFSYTHEFAYFVFPSGIQVIGKEDRRDRPDRRPLRDVSTGSHLRTDAANCFYPIFVKDSKIAGFGDVCDDSYHPENINLTKPDGTVEVYPIDPQGIERKWVFARNTVEGIIDELEAKYDAKKKQWDIMRTKSNFNFKTVWTDSKYSSNSYGSRILNEMLPHNGFNFPKSIHTVANCIDASLNNSSTGLVLDYFAGSGTTGHAVINLNRDDDGQRKYILVEMGEYFDRVTKPRIQKAAYSKDWKDGKPVSREGVSQIIKVMSLEQYEDTLDNLKLKQTQEQAELLSEHPEMHEGYMLKYMMDFESRGSASLLNLDAFDDPFSNNLNTLQDDKLKPMVIDLVETFNYLIGLNVKRIARDPAGVVTVRGTSSHHEECLILWRNVESMDWDALDAWFRDWILDAGLDVDVIYVNGDNNLENLKPDKQRWEVRLIEAEFRQLMFDVQEL